MDTIKLHLKDDNLLSWMGGFFDGEGCVNLNKSGLRVVVTNTRLDALEIFQNYFTGLGAKSKKYRRKNTTAKKVCWQLVYWSNHAELVLKTLLPYMVLKKEEAETALMYRSLQIYHGRKLPWYNAVARRMLEDKCKAQKRNETELLSVSI